MQRAQRLVGTLCLSLTLLAAATTTWAQAPAATASEFYLQYRKVFASAKKIDDLLPYMSAATRKQVESTPAAERGQMFEMVKMMGEVTGLKVVKETRTADGATLSVTALDSDKKATTGEVSIVKEGGAFKLGRESWTTK